jgi:hypothetical protein
MYHVRLLVCAHDVEAGAELAWLGLASSVLAEAPLLGWPMLHPSGGWERRDALQVVSESLSTNDWSLLFRAMSVPQRPALAFVVRGVRIDGHVGDHGVPKPPLGSSGFER